MRGLFKIHKGVEAMRIFQQMVKASVCADNTTYAIIIDGLKHWQILEQFLMLCALIEKRTRL